jgi:Leucine-rich repeat (LRR) protein
MKLPIKLLFIFSVFSFALFGCAKTSDIETLQGQIDAMKSDQIESIESQIESIRKSITSLEGTDNALQEYIDVLQERIASLKNSEEEHSDEIEALQKAVETLQEKAKDLQNQINALKEYVDGLISDTEKWANATFATIEQYNSASKIIADIQAQIEAINSKLSSTEETLVAYKTIIDSINDTIAAMKLDIEAIQKQLKDLLARIQSISYVPKYSDGRAVMTYYTDAVAVAVGTTEFDFELKPASAAEEIAALWTANPEILTMNAVYTITKSAPEIDTLAIESVSADNGFISVAVNGKTLKNKFFKGQCSASVRLSITDGNNDITSEYIPLAPEATDMKVITFGDTNFRTYCVNNFDTDGDGMISEEEARAVTRIECSLAGLTSLAGIEYFDNLEYIDVSGNSLAILDLSNSPELREVHAGNNLLLAFDPSSLILLETIDCSNNKLTSLDVSQNTALMTVDVSGNANMTRLWVKNAAQEDAITIKKDDATAIAYNYGLDLKGTGTKENPFDVASAVEMCKEIGETVSSEKYYVKGIISFVKSVSTSYGNAVFYITDNGEESDVKFCCFQCMYLGGEKFTAEDQIKYGDEVIVYGPMYNYNGNTPETGNKGSAYIYSLNGQTSNDSGQNDPYSISISVDGDMEVSSEAGSIEVTVRANQAWAVASDSEFVTVSPASGEGDGTVTITYTANEGDAVRTAAIFFTNVYGNGIGFNLNQLYPGAYMEIIWSQVDWGGGLTLTKSGYTITLDKKNGMSAPVIRGDHSARLYANGTLTISSETEMTSIIILLADEAKYRYCAVTADTGTVAAQATGDTEVKWTGTAKSVTFTVGDYAIYGSDGETKAGRLCFSGIKIM